MKILSWNVRGCNAPSKRHLIKRGIDQAKPKIIMIQETKLKGYDVSVFKKSWPGWDGAFVEAEGASRGLGILWRTQYVKGEMAANSRFSVVVKINVLIERKVFNLLNIYGPTNYKEKDEV